MTTANATHPGRVCIPGTDVGVKGTLVAEPQTENMLLALDDRLALGPVKVDTNPTGTLESPGLVVPIVSGVLWLLRFEPHRHDVPPFVLGVFNLNTSGVPLDDLVPTIPHTVSESDFDNVAALIDDLADFTTANDAVVAPLIPSGAGTATASALADSYGRGVSAKGHGAVADGTTDDSAAIRSAIAAATTAGTYTYFPEGTYLVKEETGTGGCLNLPSGAKLSGPGTIKLDTGVAAQVRPIQVLTKSDVWITDVTIDLNGMGGTGRQGVYVNDSTNLNLYRVKIANAGNGGIMLAGTTVGVRVVDCEMVTAQNGVTIYGSPGDPCGVDDVLISGCRIVTDVQPIDSEPTGGNARNVRILGNYLKTTTDNYAITMPGAPATQNSGWLVAGNTIVGAIAATYLTDSKITGNTIDATASTTRNAVHAFFNSTNIDVSGNTIRAASGMAGIYPGNAGTFPARDWTITRNEIWVAGAAGYGIRYDSGGPVTISGNRIHGVNSTAGIRPNAVTADMESVSITDNLVDGFVTGIDCRLTSTFVIKKLTVGGNHVDNTQGTPTATTGITLPSTAAQYQSVAMYGNLVAPVYTTDYSLGSVLLREGSASPATWSGNGSPESVVAARVGALFKRRDGGSGTSLYVKESGTGTTGWVAHGTSAPLQLTARLTADTTPVNNSTTAVNVTDLALAVAASSKYRLTAFITYSASVAGDVGISWGVPTGATMSWSVNAVRPASTGATGASDTINRASSAAGSVGQAGGIGAGTKVVAMPFGTVTTSTTAGTLQLKFAQVVADASDAVIYADSWITLEKVS